MGEEHDAKHLVCFDKVEEQVLRVEVYRLFLLLAVALLPSLGRRQRGMLDPDLGRGSHAMPILPVHRHHIV